VPRNSWHTRKESWTARVLDGPRRLSPLYKCDLGSDNAIVFRLECYGLFCPV
jgi:hypothetical protein